MTFDEENIKIFEKNTIEEYNKSLIIEKFCKVNSVDRIDKDFIQIGIRPLIDEDIFIKNSNVYPNLPSAGRFIAVGERDYLIKNILDNKDLKVIKIKKDEIKEFSKYLDFNEASILISTEFYVEIFDHLMHRIDYNKGYPKLDSQYRLITVPKNILGKRIIFVDNLAILWEKKKFYNEFTEKNETLDIKITSKGNKADITIRSFNKIKNIRPELINILEVEG